MQRTSLQNGLSALAKLASLGSTMPCRTAKRFIHLRLHQVRSQADRCSCPGAWGVCSRKPHHQNCGQLLQPLDPVEATTVLSGEENFDLATPTVPKSVSSRIPAASLNDLDSMDGVQAHSVCSAAMRTDRRSVALASGRFVRFQLVDDKDGAVMVLANLPFTEQELHELAGVSQAVGREFGVTVHRIVIRGINKQPGSTT